MAKRKGFDVIEDAHELANHNYHHPYWINRVTSYTYATWMAEKKLSLIILPILITLWFTAIKALTGAGSKDNNFWKTLFDFSDAFTTSRFVAFLFLVFYTIVTLIASSQVVIAMIQKPIRQPERTESKKKKHPKRRKDYGRD